MQSIDGSNFKSSADLLAELATTLLGLPRKSPDDLAYITNNELNAATRYVQPSSNDIDTSIMCVTNLIKHNISRRLQLLISNTILS
jgi:hypothetical protein